MMNYNFTEEDIKFVERAIELKAKGYYIDSMQLTEHYNRILNKNVNNTTCVSCMRQRVSELEGALNHYKSKMAISRGNDSVPEEEPRPSKGLEGNEVALPTVTKEDKNKSIRKKK